MTRSQFLPIWLDLSGIPITLWECYAGLSTAKLEVYSDTLVQGGCHTVVLLLQPSTSTPVRLLNVAVGEPRPYSMALRALLANKG